jgi:hypothetical protein
MGQLGDYSPRSRNGVGPTIRVSEDAHEVIMGPDNGHPKGVRRIAEGQHRLSDIGGAAVAHPPRSSSLPSSTETVQNKQPDPSVGMYSSLLLLIAL